MSHCLHYVLCGEGPICGTTDGVYLRTLASKRTTKNHANDACRRSTGLVSVYPRHSHYSAQKNVQFIASLCALLCVCAVSMVRMECVVCGGVI